MAAIVNKKPRKRKILFPGVVADARALGCHVRTLQRTLNGVYKLPGLLGRYKELKARQAAQVSAPAFNRLKPIAKKAVRR